MFDGHIDTGDTEVEVPYFVLMVPKKESQQKCLNALALKSLAIIPDYISPFNPTDGPIIK